MQEELFDIEKRLTEIATTLRDANPRTKAEWLAIDQLLTASRHVFSAASWLDKPRHLQSP